MIRKDIKRVVVEYFLVNPTAKLRVRGIERTLKMPLPSVIRYCKELAEEGVLTIIKTGNVRFYTANRANENYLLVKKLFNLRQVFESGLIEHLRRELSNPTIVLFGSYLRGEDIEGSDVDLYLETQSNKKLDLMKYEQQLKRGIQLLRHKSIKEIPNHHLANNIINGLTINGFLEVFK
ncbi:MAG: nucleotidyltransferase domain-containing protein [Candidatus Nanoarchaeia archaeon]|jgi:predicted nucleotidyltransferase